MPGLPDALTNAIASSPLALALVFVGVLVARVLDRRLGEIAVALGSKPRAKAKTGASPTRGVS